MYVSWLYTCILVQVCPTLCLKVEFNFVKKIKKNVDKYGLAEVLLLCSDSPLSGEDALVYIIYVCQYLVLVLITIETIHHPLFPPLFHYNIICASSGLHSINSTSTFLSVESITPPVPPL